jgi:hypothetical protein
MYQPRSRRELGVKNAHLQFPQTHTNRSFNMAPVQARYVWYPSRSFGYGVGVQANDANRLFLDEPCGVRVEPKALPPENVAAGGVAGICAHLRRRSKRGGPCTECIHASADVTKRCTHGWSVTVWESDRAKSGVTVVATKAKGHYSIDYP